MTDFFTNQLNKNNISLGINAGLTNQSTYAIAIGYNAGQYSQQLNSIAIGYNTSVTNQGTNSIAIGYLAGSNQSNNSIIINASGSIVTGNNTNATYIAPIRNITQSYTLGYDISAMEISYFTSTSIPNIIWGQSLNWNNLTNNWQIIGSNNIALGNYAGQNMQQQYAISIGTYAGNNSQGSYTIAIGYSAGQTQQNPYAIAIGYQAGQYLQGTNAIAIGYNAGCTQQGQDTVAISGGNYYQNTGAIAIGLNAGYTSQGQYGIAIGLNAGSVPFSNTQLNDYSIAIGYNAGQTGQSSNAIAIGYNAGKNNQPCNSIIIGTDSETNNTGAIVIGNSLKITSPSSQQNTISISNTSQTITQYPDSIFISNVANVVSLGYYSIAICNKSVNTHNISLGTSAILIGLAHYQCNYSSVCISGLNNNTNIVYDSAIVLGFRMGAGASGSIKIGDNCSPNHTNSNTIALGPNAGETKLGTYSIAIGVRAAGFISGQYCVTIGRDSGGSQGEQAIAIGYGSGKLQASNWAVAIGTGAGDQYTEQGCVAIGHLAGKYQLAYSIAIGSLTHRAGTGIYCIALGYRAGQTNQQNGAISLGNTAGSSNQGMNSIAIGYGYGVAGLAQSSILINALATSMVGPTAYSCYVRPIRGTAASSPVLTYNTTNFEVCYNTSSIKYKKNVIDLTQDTSKILSVRAREYDSIDNDIHHIGYIAEELNDIDSWFTWKNTDNTPGGIEWFNMLIYTIEEMKKIDLEIIELTNRIAILENKL
jgi:hypothetical protein